MRKFFCFTLAAIIIFSFTGCVKKEKTEKKEAEPIKIRIGWVSPFGLLPPEEEFKSELAKYGLDAEIKLFEETSYSDFFVVKDFDIIFSDEMLTGFFLKLEKKYFIVGRTLTVRTGLVVLPKSKIKSPEDLRGKIIGGSAAQFRTAIDAMEKYGMHPSQDYFLLDIDVRSTRELVSSSQDKEKGGQFDAALAFDPMIAWTEEKGYGKLIYEDSTSFPILANKDFISNNPEAMVNFFIGFKAVLENFRKNLIEEKKVEIPELDQSLQKNILRKTLSYDTNYDENNEKEIRFYFHKNEIDDLQHTVDLIFSLPNPEDPINIMDYIDTSFAEKATERKIKQEN